MLGAFISSIMPYTRNGIRKYLLFVIEVNIPIIISDRIETESIGSYENINILLSEANLYLL